MRELDSSAMFTVVRIGPHTAAYDDTAVVLGGPNNLGGADGEDAAAVIQAALDALPTSGGVVALREGAFELERSLHINTSGAVLRGQGANATILEWTRDKGAAIEMGKEPGPHWYMDVADLCVRHMPSGPSKGIGIRLWDETYRGQLSRVRVLGGMGFGETVGIELKAESDWMGYYTITNPEVTWCHTGIKFSGAAHKTGLTVMGGYIQGPGRDATGSVCFLARSELNTSHVFGLSLSDAHTLMKLRRTSYANDFHGVRFEEAKVGIFIDDELSNFNQFFGGSIANIDNIFRNKGIGNEMRGYYGCRTEYSGEVSIPMGKDRVKVDHTLDEVPRFVSVTADSGHVHSVYVTNKTKKTFTVINKDGKVNYPNVLMWYAKAF